VRTSVLFLTDCHISFGTDTGNAGLPIDDPLVIEQRIPDQAAGSDSGIENRGDLLAVPRLRLLINEPQLSGSAYDR
jgi:hypothetical protein